MHKDSCYFDIRGLIKKIHLGTLGLLLGILVIILMGCVPSTKPPLSKTEETQPPTLPTTGLRTTSAPIVTSTPTIVPTTTEVIPPAGKYFFDDFNYPDRQSMTASGWIIREEAGWPGIPGANWQKENVSIINDPDQDGNFLIQMTSSTDGTAAGTSQSQFCHQRKYLEGTYAARVRFSDSPDVGPDGDQIVETFYMISPLAAPLDPDYSEMDNEYLPNGGWGHVNPTYFVTSWETVQIEPWNADNASDFQEGSLAGWHTFVMQVVGSDIFYLLDGKLVKNHWGKYFPEAPMSINFNLWFVNGGLIQSKELRRYREYVDWVYFAADQRLTPPEVEARVSALRSASFVFQDSVPALDPLLPSPCNF